MELKSGQMEKSMWVDGAITKCMEEELSLGLMVKYIMVITLMTKSMAQVNSPGPTADFIKVNGKMVSKTEKECTLAPTDKKRMHYL